MAFVERYYQREARAAIKNGFKQHGSGLLVLGTGAGKTSVAGKTIAELDGRVLFLGDQNELVTQPLRAIQQASGVIAALEQAKHVASLQARVVVGSSQTFARKKRRERYRPDHFNYIIVDEAHRGARRDAEICDYFETAQTLGMTATPFTHGLRDLSKYYETVFYRKPMLDLCIEGFAPEPEWCKMPVEIDLERCATAMTPDGKEYKADDVDSTITPHLREVARLVAEHARHRHIIAYLPLIKTSTAFAAVLREVGITAMHVDGGSPDREQILEGFARGQFQCLCNAGVVSIGVDLPIADAFLNLCPLNSPALYQQRLGRTMRTLPGVIDNLPEQTQAAARRERILWSDKPNALVMDPLWQHEKLSVQNPLSLVCDDEDLAKRMHAAVRAQMAPVDLIALQARVQKEREAELVDALKKAVIKAQLAQPITFEQAAYVIGSAKLMGYEPVARWELEKPSDAQKRSLANLGINPKAVTTKGAASKLLDELHFRINHRFATLKQTRLIIKINEGLPPGERMDNPGQKSIAEAAAFLDTHMARRKAERLVDA